MIDLKEFRKSNGLTQAVVAEYLGVSEPFISRVESGRDPLPEDKLDKLIKNDRGWVVKSFQTPDGKVKVTIRRSGSSNDSKQNKSWEQKKIEMLEQRIAQLEQQNAEYWDLIKKLTDR